jgi:hypothetical protein
MQNLYRCTRCADGLWVLVNFVEVMLRGLVSRHGKIYPQGDSDSTLYHREGTTDSKTGSKTCFGHSVVALFVGEVPKRDGVVVAYMHLYNIALSRVNSSKVPHFSVALIDKEFF